MKTLGPWTIVDSRRWWDERQRERPYPWKCELSQSVGVDPRSAETFGPNRSAVMRRGVRTYAFETEEACLKFCEVTGARRVE